jgi:hypothetical protein
MEHGYVVIAHGSPKELAKAKGVMHPTAMASV